MRTPSTISGTCHRPNPRTKMSDSSPASVRIERADHTGSEVDGLVKAVLLERPQLVVRDHCATLLTAWLMAEDVQDLLSSKRAVVRVAGGVCGAGTVPGTCVVPTFGSCARRCTGRLGTVRPCTTGVEDANGGGHVTWLFNAPRTNENGWLFFWCRPQRSVVITPPNGRRQVWVDSHPGILGDESAITLRLQRRDRCGDQRIPDQQLRHAELVPRVAAE